MIGVFMAVLSLCSPGSALLGPGHRTVWFACLGIDDAASQARIQTTLVLFSACIDDLEDDVTNDGTGPFCSDDIKIKFAKAHPETYAKLSSDFVFGFCSGTVHRLLFHWGYNVVDPERAESAKPFRDRLEARLDEETSLSDWDREVVTEFYYNLVREAFVSRNRKMKTLVGQGFGLNKEVYKNFTTPLATVLYEIHILCDYCTPERDSLGSLEYHVRKELLERGIARLFPGNKNMRALCDEIESIADGTAADVSPSAERLNRMPPEFQGLFVPSANSVEQQKALGILLLLREGLPPLMSSFFEEPLADVGITITSRSSSKTPSLKGWLADKFSRGQR
ncbi:MAG TPA: hypothetical protein PK468_18880 [Candidatus Hydrogenedentes bacterium]|nr:hypothetical protein [Candidatus Hydrogenedentota bacterium]